MKHTKVFGLLIALFLCMVAVQAAPVPALVCKYMDPVYSTKWTDPVIIFGPTDYEENLMGKMTTYNAKSFVAYNNRYKSLLPMEITKFEGNSITAVGKLVRPHHNRTSQVIDAKWRLIKEPKQDYCKYDIEKLLKVFDLLGKKQQPNIEYWSMDRGGIHRKLYLACVWEKINPPPQIGSQAAAFAGSPWAVEDDDGVCPVMSGKPGDFSNPEEDEEDQG